MYRAWFTALNMWIRLLRRRFLTDYYGGREGHSRPGGRLESARRPPRILQAAASNQPGGRLESRLATSNRVRFYGYQYTPRPTTSIKWRVKVVIIICCRIYAGDSFRWGVLLRSAGYVWMKYNKWISLPVSFTTDILIIHVHVYSGIVTLRGRGLRCAMLIRLYLWWPRRTLPTGIM